VPLDLRVAGTAFTHHRQFFGEGRRPVGALVVVCHPYLP
jgi:hypothetical protein